MMMMVLLLGSSSRTYEICTLALAFLPQLQQAELLQQQAAAAAAAAATVYLDAVAPLGASCVVAASGCCCCLCLLQVLDDEERVEVARELEGNVLTCIGDQNGRQSCYLFSHREDVSLPL